MTEDLQTVVDFANETFEPLGKKINHFVKTYYDLPTPSGENLIAIVEEELACYLCDGNNWRKLFGKK